MYLRSNDLEIAYVAFLEAIQAGQGIPDGCDKTYLQSHALAECDSAGWHLTEQGKQQLQRWGAVGQALAG